MTKTKTETVAATAEEGAMAVAGQHHAAHTDLKEAVRGFLEQYVGISLIEEENGFIIQLGAYDRLNVITESDYHDADNLIINTVFADADSRVEKWVSQEYPGAPTEEYLKVQEYFSRNEDIKGLSKMQLSEIQKNGSLTELDNGLEQEVLHPLLTVVTEWLTLNDSEHLLLSR